MGGTECHGRSAPAGYRCSRQNPAPFNKFRPLEKDAGSRLEDEDTAAASTIVWNLMTQSPFGFIRSHRKGDTYRAKMNG